MTRCSGRTSLTSRMPTLATCARNFFSGPYEIRKLHKRARPNIAHSRVEGSPLRQIIRNGLGQLVRARAVYSIQSLIFLFSFRKEDETKRYPYFVKAANNSHPMTLRVFLVKRSKPSSPLPSRDLYSKWRRQVGLKARRRCHHRQERGEVGVNRSAPAHWWVSRSPPSVVSPLVRSSSSRAPICA